MVNCKTGNFKVVQMEIFIIAVFYYNFKNGSKNKTPHISVKGQLWIHWQLLLLLLFFAISFLSELEPFLTSA